MLVSEIMRHVTEDIDGDHLDVHDATQMNSIPTTSRARVGIENAPARCKPLQVGDRQLSTTALDDGEHRGVCRDIGVVNV